MSDKPPTKPALPPTSVLRARFATAIKLGQHELAAWHHDRVAGWVCEVSPAGLVFVPVDESPCETVVPYANVVSYERGRRP